MPFPRGKKPNVTAGSKIPKLLGKGMENQEEGPQVKRSSSSPQGAPKKRTAFVDITNAHNVHISLPGTKKNSLIKKTQKKKATTTVSDKNEANLTKSESVSSERGEEETPAEELVVQEAVPPRELPPHLQRPQIPEEFDIDTQHQDDPTLTPQYAKEIFDYLKAREEKFILSDYMSIQPSLNAGMRAILVDWLVEVQENFELNHETLYLAVKVLDHFLSTAPVNRENLQLIGSTAMLIASKFEERCPPCVDDFLYVCDDAYKREEVIAMETSILQALGFDINIPVSYRFLRRYAKCVSASMETLTLARYVCELSLQEMDLVPERGSLLASACLLLALVTKELGGWSPILVFHSGYGVSELVPVVRRLHSMLTSPPDDKLLAVRSKYSHKVFFEVATIPTVDLETLERALQ
ncbi:G2/mitotic-specific cyclin-B3 [Salmo salar]|uniref:G2/mitotic-specific cyclin-B3 n=1 Tax=Salmo salar TaxID=8030 RepID=B5X3I5_SALSA|nr:G2/mitotic-specific cyclin-B3 [Salmo salar]ACI33866.1 G2/mitotic-specific cyclin-B3 [Salmo salar]|eukprot:NP_001133768.1 G2/mitotic-specific cyclin-B3 [Salmo salar]